MLEYSALQWSRIIGGFTLDSDSTLKDARFNTNLYFFYFCWAADICSTPLLFLSRKRTSGVQKAVQRQTMPHFIPPFSLPSTVILVSARGAVVIEETPLQGFATLPPGSHWTGSAAKTSYFQICAKAVAFWFTLDLERLPSVPQALLIICC